MRLHIIDAGCIDYEEALALQNRLQSQRLAEEIPDTLILLEHPPVITLGRRGKNTDVLISPEAAGRAGIKTICIDRGGEVTYHGPGQLVGYFICGLEITDGSISRFVHRIEEALILSLKRGWNLRARARKDYIGVWVSSPRASGGDAAFPETAAAESAPETDEAKIAAIGLSVSRGVTKHGFALNVNTDMEHFRWIIPCGIRTMPVTSLQKILNKKIPLEDVKRRVEADIQEVFGYDA